MVLRKEFYYENKEACYLCVLQGVSSASNLS